MLPQKRQLGLGLHAFGDGFQVQPVGHLDDGLDNAGVLLVVGQALDKRLVDLELADAEAFQIAQ